MFGNIHKQVEIRKVESFGHLQRRVRVPLLELFDSLTNKLAFGKTDSSTTFTDTIRFRKSVRYVRVDGHLQVGPVGPLRQYDQLVPVRLFIAFRTL